MRRSSRSRATFGGALTVMLLLGLPLPGAAQNWRADVGCGQPVAPPAKVEREACVSAHCVPLPDGRVCSCVPSTTSDTIHFTWEQERQTRGRWQVDTFTENGSNFEVVSVQLGEPPVPGWLVAARLSVSGGLGVEAWSVRTLADGVLSNEVRVDDYGALAFPTRSGPSEECELLATRWLQGTAPARGEGMYLYGRWFRFRDGVLAPDPTRPLIARRLLGRFSEQRLAAMDSARREPLLWYRGATDAPPPCDDPFCK